MTYEVIPWAPRYEINQFGAIRNRETGKTLTWLKSKNTKMMRISYQGKSYWVSQPSLLREMFGQPTRQGSAKPVRLSKGNRSMYFDSMNQCTGYLAKYCGLTKGTARYRLTARKAEIAGWKVQYFD